MHTDPKQTTSQMTIAENTDGTLARVQRSILNDNDEALVLILFVMERRFGFAGAILATDVSTRCLVRYDWLCQWSASENLK
jgi:hypothetical protein